VDIRRRERQGEDGTRPLVRLRQGTGQRRDEGGRQREPGHCGHQRRRETGEEGRGRRPTGREVAEPEARRLLTRWAKEAVNYLGFVHRAATLLIYRKLRHARAPCG